MADRCGIPRHVHQPILPDYYPLDHSSQTTFLPPTHIFLSYWTWGAVYLQSESTVSGMKDTNFTSIGHLSMVHINQKAETLHEKEIKASGDK
jgi:hypothetical protein